MLPIILLVRREFGYTHVECRPERARSAVGSMEERAANLGAILATQAHWLTERLLDRQARDFETGGGFSERLYRLRTGKPSPSIPLVPSVKSVKSVQLPPRPQKPHA